MFVCQDQEDFDIHINVNQMSVCQGKDGCNILLDVNKMFIGQGKEGCDILLDINQMFVRQGKGGCDIILDPRWQVRALTIFLDIIGRLWKTKYYFSNFKILVNLFS